MPPLVFFSQSERYSGGRGQHHPTGQFTARLLEFHMIQVWEWIVGKAGAVNSPWQFYLDCQIKQNLLLWSWTWESLARSTLAPSYSLTPDEKKKKKSLARPIKVYRAWSLFWRLHFKAKTHLRRNKTLSFYFINQNLLLSICSVKRISVGVQVFAQVRLRKNLSWTTDYNFICKTGWKCLSYGCFHHMLTCAESYKMSTKTSSINDQQLVTHSSELSHLYGNNIFHCTSALAKTSINQNIVDEKPS